MYVTICNNEFKLLEFNIDLILLKIRLFNFNYYIYEIRLINIKLKNLYSFYFYKC